MHRFLKILLLFLAVLVVVSSPPAGAAPSEKRLALVIGNASYNAKTLATAANDAALVAQTLRAAGFDVMGARDLDEDLLRKTFRDFVDRVAKAGPDAVAVVYFAGYGLQFEGENYLVPIKAGMTNISDAPVRALRLSEQTHALAALHLKTAFVVLDAARASPLVLSGQPPASGLAWVEPETNMLIAFNAAPGTVSPDEGNGYGPYAKAFAEMIREGGLTPVNLFDRVRLRVAELTKGAQVPWDTSKIQTQFVFFERGPDAPPRADSPEHTAWMRSQPMRKLGAQDAYMVALMRDTFDAYADFLADYWHDPMTKRVRALIAARREAITWRRTYQANVPDAYWSYLERYPRGAHLADAHNLLKRLGATIAPPVKFAMMAYDVPPPLPDELEYVERTVLVFDDPAFGFEPQQPSPANFLEPPPPEFLALAPPAAASGAHLLALPTFVSLPVYIRLPSEVMAPPKPFVVANEETPVINITNDRSAKQDKQAVSSSISSPGANNRSDSPDLTSSTTKETTSINSRSAPPALNPEPRRGAEVPQPSSVPAASSAPLWATYGLTAQEDIKVPENSSVLVASGTPLWATYDPTVSEDIRAPRSSLVPAGMPRRTSRAAGGIPQPISRAAALTVPTARAAMPSPQTTGSIPTSTGRSGTPMSLPIHNRPKRIAPAASRSSPTGVDQAVQTTAPPPNRPAPPPHLVRAPDVAPVSSVSPRKPQRKPCPIVDGRPVCG